MKHAFVTTCLHGIPVALRTDGPSVRSLFTCQHPLATGHPLIRLGSQGDGCYLVLEDLESIAAYFSPGVDDRASFESSLIQRGIPCYLDDGSVDRAPIALPLVHFAKKCVRVISGSTQTDRALPKS